MKPFFAVFKPGVRMVFWGAVILMTAGCALPIGSDYTVPVPKEADPTTPSSSSPSGQVPYVAEYNLQLYVPVPVAGKQPVKQAANRVGMEVQVVWKNAGGEDITEGLDVFENGVVYQAEITLAAKNGYEFAADIPFAYEEGMVREQSSDDNDHPTSRTVHAEYRAATDFSPTPFSFMVDQTDLTGHIPAPAAGNSPVSLFLDPQYAGRVQWKADGIPAEGAFKPLTAYEAVVTLIASSGYTFTGLPANAFSHTGALGVSSEADSGAVTISFAATGIFAVENYNLQNYVPIPAAGEKAVKTVDRNELSVVVVWKDEGGADITNDLDRFVFGEVYQAEITLTAKSGYVFKTDQPFAYPDGAGASSPGGDNSHAGLRTLTVTYNQTKAPTTVTDTNLTRYIPAPVTGSTGIGYFTAPQYSGAVDWKITGDAAHSGPFAAGTEYTATVTLTPNTGYQFAQNTVFSHKGGNVGSVSDAGDGKVAVSIAFAAIPQTPLTTVTKVTDTNLTRYIPAPVTGSTGIGYFNAPQYSGTVAWTKTAGAAHSGLFAADTPYTATVTLTPAAGYTFAGVEADDFTHDGAASDPDPGSVSYDADAKTVTVKFAATPKILISGPIDLTPYLPAPVWGQLPAAALTVLPVSPFTGGPVTWKKGNENHNKTTPFAVDTAYTATVTLAPAPGHAFDDGTAFTHSQSDGVTVAGDNRTVTIKFKKTLGRMIGDEVDLAPYATPKVGAKKVTDFVAVAHGCYGTIDWQYTGDDKDGVSGDFFVAGGIYRAHITLTPFPGHAFDPDIYEDFDSDIYYIGYPAGAELELNGVSIDYTGALKITLRFPRPLVGSQS